MMIMTATPQEYVTHGTWMMEVIERMVHVVAELGMKPIVRGGTVEFSVTTQANVTTIINAFNAEFSEYENPISMHVRVQHDA